jgi:hypothetical protein
VIGGSYDLYSIDIPTVFDFSRLLRGCESD